MQLTVWVGAGVVIVSLLLVAIVYFEPIEVVSFDSCVVGGGQLEDMFPRRCVYRGEIYVERLAPSEFLHDQEKGVSDYESEQLVWVIGPNTIFCEGVTEGECLVVDGKPFGEIIHGFDYRPGNIYKIVVDKSLAFGTRDPSEIPADASLYRYDLDRVASVTYVFTPESEKEPVVEKPFVPTVEELVVNIGPFVVDCGRFDQEPCLVVNGNPVSYNIQNFVHETGFSYVLEITKTQRFPEGTVIQDVDPFMYELVREVNKAPLPGFEPAVEILTTSTSTATTSASSSELN